MNIEIVRLLDFYSTWIILWVAFWSFFRLGPSPWLPFISILVGGIIIEVINWFRNETPLWFVLISIVLHLIPLLAFNIKEDYHIETLVVSAFLYLLFMKDKIAGIYNNPYKHLFGK